ncbi:hypothetical protein RFI_04445 [Reticulomyxa filosa]|uniref:Uncharacterized protein n=1 Tax=Reticulomyxa filosa TaxID=46433 RepID=X6P508_RETFI|nr:hypothetical protein RFI_04445 [Reticulomyxa filosa]|eukprot:ETO32672.1 hypothetical protein RFI_04445 [Reticulomyxa filosa]
MESETLNLMTEDEKCRSRSDDDKSCSSEKQRQLLTIDTVIANPGFSNINVWKCPRHRGDKKCCRRYINTKCLGWDSNYLAFVFIPAESVISSKEWVSPTNKQTKKKQKKKIKENNEQKGKLEMGGGKKKESKGRIFFPSKGCPESCNKHCVRPSLLKKMEIDTMTMSRKSLPWFWTMAAGFKQAEQLCG